MMNDRIAMPSADEMRMRQLTLNLNALLWNALRDADVENLLEIENERELRRAVEDLAVKIAEGGQLFDGMLRQQLKERDAALLDRALYPPLMLVSVAPADVADAKRWRDLQALPWWRRIARAMAAKNARS